MIKGGHEKHPENLYFVLLGTECRHNPKSSTLEKCQQQGERKQKIPPQKSVWLKSPLNVS